MHSNKTLPCYDIGWKVNPEIPKQSRGYWSEQLLTNMITDLMGAKPSAGLHTWNQEIQPRTHQGCEGHRQLLLQWPWNGGGSHKKETRKIAGSLEFRRAGCGLLRCLLGEILCNASIERRGDQNSQLSFKYYLLQLQNDPSEHAGNQSKAGGSWKYEQGGSDKAQIEKGSVLQEVEARMGELPGI